MLFLPHIFQQTFFKKWIYFCFTTMSLSQLMKLKPILWSILYSVHIQNLPIIPKLLFSISLFEFVSKEIPHIAFYFLHSLHFYTLDVFLKQTGLVISYSRFVCLRPVEIHNWIPQPMFYLRRSEFLGLIRFRFNLSYFFMKISTDDAVCFIDDAI